MPYRLTQIITKTGDSGTTGLGDGSRVPKSSLRIIAIGEVERRRGGEATLQLALPAS